MCLSGKIVQHAGAAPRVAVVAELENDDEDTTLCASIRRTAEERERDRRAPLRASDSRHGLGKPAEHAFARECLSMCCTVGEIGAKLCNISARICGGFFSFSRASSCAQQRILYARAAIYVMRKEKERYA